MRLMIAGALALALFQEKPDHGFPLAKGTKWTYRIRGEEKTWTLSEKKKIQGMWRDVIGECRALEGSGLYLVETAEGLRLVTERSVGYHGGAAIVTVAEFRWTGKDRWTFETMDGCLVWTVECKRVGAEKIAVPAGTFECVKFQNGDETWWVAKGVGIVKRSEKKTTWELSSYAVK